MTVDNFEGLLKLAKMYDIQHVRDEYQRVACQAEVSQFTIMGSENGVNPLPFYAILHPTKFSRACLTKKHIIAVNLPYTE